MSTDTLTLTDFLLARIAEDEAVARPMWNERATRRAMRLPVEFSWPTPDRVLAECEAHRQIVERFQFIAAGEGETTALAFHEQGLFEAVTMLAAVYADHPDYRDEWRG